MPRDYEVVCRGCDGVVLVDAAGGWLCPDCGAQNVPCAECRHCPGGVCGVCRECRGGSLFEEDAGAVSATAAAAPRPAASEPTQRTADECRAVIGGRVYAARSFGGARREDDRCRGCAANGIGRIDHALCNALPSCMAEEREDGRDVIFEESPGADPFRHALVEAVQTAVVAQQIVECLLRSAWKWPRPPSPYDPAKRYRLADGLGSALHFRPDPARNAFSVFLGAPDDGDALVATGDECSALARLLESAIPAMLMVEEVV